MQLVASNDEKVSSKISAALKDTSCSRGWLKVVVQTIFGLITVLSFILILFMTIMPPIKISRDVERCDVKTCSIVCVQAPYYDEHTHDLFHAISIAQGLCQSLTLELRDAFFINATLPLNWLSRLRVEIHEISIIGGNLRNILPYTFLSQFSSNLQTLVLENITISKWSEEMLVGLANLKELFIRDSEILEIERNAIKPVQDTLSTLTITGSGYWHPRHVTGGSYTQITKFRVVDFSYNNFDNILNRFSFTRLSHVRILYLNSCKITAISAGTFDDFNNIEVLYLNNNYIVTIPAGLFDNILKLNNPRPRIHLSDNLWLCDCSMDSFPFADAIQFNPVCHYPENIRGMTFFEFDLFCKKNTSSMYKNIHSVDQININHSCPENHNISNSLLCQVNKFKCIDNRVTYDMILQSEIQNVELQERLKPTFLLNGRSTIQLKPTGGMEPYGLIWYDASCPDYMYCVNSIPKLLTVSNMEYNIEYTFCPVLKTTGKVAVEKCVSYNLTDKADELKRRYKIIRPVMYTFTSLSCLVFGALCVYTVIRKYPSLLRGSNRILFVKHKKVDALILPPKVPFRKLNSLLIEEDLPGKDSNIFVLPANKSFGQEFVRTKSDRSIKSNAPSYISALQPTEDQLDEWRRQHDVDNYSTITSISSDASMSLFYRGDSLYCSINQYDISYNS